jgi:hypothetical protein
MKAAELGIELEVPMNYKKDRKWQRREAVMPAKGAGKVREMHLKLMMTKKRTISSLTKSQERERSNSDEDVKDGLFCRKPSTETVIKPG